MDPLRVIDQADQHAADRQRILDGVLIFEQRRGDGPVLDPLLLSVVVGVVPDVPFVEGEVNPLGRAASGGGGIAEGADFLDEGVHLVGSGEEAGGVAVAVAEVGVDGEVVDVVEGVVEDGRLPGAEARHAAMAGAADDQLDGRIDPLHQLGGLGGDSAVLLGGLVAHLPGAVHLVAEAPEFHAVRLLKAVSPPQIAPGGAAGMVAVLDQVAGGIRPAGAEIDRQHRLGLGGAAPGDELVGAELVGLGRLPGEIEAARPLLARPDAVFPVVTGDEVAAGIAHHRHVQLGKESEDIVAEAVGVGGRMAGLIDAFVDAAAKVFGKAAKETGIDNGLGCAGGRGMEADRGLHVVGLGGG